MYGVFVEDNPPDRESLAVYVMAPVVAVLLLTSVVVVFVVLRHQRRSSTKTQSLRSRDAMIQNLFYDGAGEVCVPTCTNVIGC